MSHLAVVNGEQFTEALSTGVVLADFYAVWCQPCQALTPILEQVAEQLGDKASIVKIDVDESTEIAVKYSVSSMPTMIIFKDGEEKQRFVGVQAGAKILEAVTAYL